MGIGKTLNILLAEKGVTANELAVKAGVTPSTIYSILKRDNTKADIEVLLKICRALNVDVERFYQEYYSELGFKPIVHNTLSTNEKRIIELFKELDEIQQENIIAKAELLVEQNKEFKRKEG